MADLFAGGLIVDLILGLTLVEALVLAAYHRRTGRGVAPTPLVANLLAGAFLLLALRASLASAGWAWIAACLAGSLVAHLSDLRARWSAPSGP